MPVLEDLPTEEKVRRGNVLLKTRPRDVEETLLHLINDDDQVVAAAAIDVVRAEPDVDARPTTSSTCWRIATCATGMSSRPRRGRSPSSGMPAERRRELWLEPLPAAEIAGRLRDAAALRLGQRRRAVPHRRRGPAGAPPAGHACCCRKASVPDTIHLLLDGRVVAASRDAARRAPSRRRRRSASSRRCRAVRCARRCGPTDTAVTLALTVDELRTLLADNTDLVRGLFATLADRVDPATCSNLQSTGRSAGAARGSPPTACCRSKRFSRCSACRSSRGSSADEMRRSRRSRIRSSMNDGRRRSSRSPRPPRCG